MKKILTLTALILCFTYGFSQSEKAWYQLNNRNIDLQEKWQAFGVTEAKFNAIKDNAYANPEFIKGNVFQNDQLMQKDVPLRYNSYSDEIEIKNGSSSEYGALIRDPSIFVKVLKDNYVLIPYEGSNEKGAYFSILTDGKNYDLYKKVKSTFNQPYVAKTSYERDRDPSFTKTTTYYLVQNGKFYELPDSKSKILKVMDKKKKEIKSYIKVNNLDLDNEDDLIKLVNYFDSLL